MISLDTETTGIDFRHGARPFFVTTCDSEGVQRFWEWEVDPLTREPQIPDSDLHEIGEFLFQDEVHTVSDGLVLQNAKFDFTALEFIGFWKLWDKATAWNFVQDTLIAGHVLASGMPHDLTSMALQYLGVDIEPLEKALEEAVKECRRLVQQDNLRMRRGGRPGTIAKTRARSTNRVEVGQFQGWMIADEGLECMPSAGGKNIWRFDYWLPRAVAKELKLPPEHRYWTVLRDYANADSAVTLPLFVRMKSEMERRGLWKIYRERMNLPSIVHRMETRGVTVSRTRLEEQQQEYREESERLSRVCVNIAESYGYTLSMPRGGNNDALREFAFEVLHLPPVKKSKETGRPSLDKYVLDHYLGTLNERSREYAFVKALSDKRKRDSAVSYMEGYKRFWLPWSPEWVPMEKARRTGTDWYVLHPSLNITGTATLRFSSSDPNEQNISKREGFNLRLCFGPTPGREWWSLDAQNIELRIPAYEAGEEEMIALFERPNDPPYFGSNHLLNAHILWPDLFEACRSDVGIDGRVFKKKYASTYYQWVKNGDFAITYGAIEQSGTADRAFHTPGAQRKLQSRFTRMDALNKKCISFAEKHGYVETIPDRSVDPTRGYPLMCTRTEWGKILPTVPLNYHVQGTAMWWTARAMVRVQAQLDEWRKTDGFDGHIALQVHDELVLDFPKKGDPAVDKEREKEGPLVFADHQGRLTISRGPGSSNLWRIRVIQQLMAKGGEDIDIPTPVGCEYHANNWAEGVTL